MERMIIALPLKIFLKRGLVQRIEDRHGDIVPAEVWDADTEGTDPTDLREHDGCEYYIYEI